VDAEPYPFPLVVSNSVLAIVAGSDTSATVLANTFFLLLSHRESYKRLKLEVDEAFPRAVKEPTDPALLSSLPYLNAVMYVFLATISIQLNHLPQQRVSAIVPTGGNVASARTESRNWR
jgi:hypothetical protein